MTTLLQWVASRGRRLLVAGAAILLLAAIVLVARQLIGSRCGGVSGCDAEGFPVGAVSVKDVETRTEATLYYPGATLVSHATTPETDAAHGKNPAYAVTLLATSDTPTQVYAWYQSWAMGHGWQPTDVLQGSAELSIRAWRRGSRETLNVGIMDPMALRQMFPHQVPSGQTIIETRYIIWPPGAPHF